MNMHPHTSDNLLLASGIQQKFKRHLRLQSSVSQPKYVRMIDLPVNDIFTSVTIVSTGSTGAEITTKKIRRDEGIMLQHI